MGFYGVHHTVLYNNFGFVNACRKREVSVRIYCAANFEVCPLKKGGGGQKILLNPLFFQKDGSSTPGPPLCLHLFFFVISKSTIFFSINGMGDVSSFILDNT